MRKATDAVVEPGDLLAAIEEIKRGEGVTIMERLHQVEPHLSLYIEGMAAHLNGTAISPSSGVIGMDRTLNAILTIVRALELGHYRLFRKMIPPSSPLARVMASEPEKRAKDQPKP